jgi:dolichyldiphosphatase
MDFLRLIDRGTKYVVSFAVLIAVLRTGLSPRACYDVIGSILSSILNKALKRVLNVTRPDGAAKTDPGMPSSHANSLGFLATTAAIHSGNRTLAFVVSGLGAFLAYLRVHSGYHTFPQVLVGFGLGSLSAIAWDAWSVGALQWWTRTFAANAEWGLRIAALGAMVVFTVGNAPGWVWGR